MFGKRPDGKLVKHLGGLYFAMPIIMKTRNDSMNMLTFDVELEPIKKFIKEEQERTGRVYSYSDILIAAIVRTIALRPDLNRFIVNQRIYQRNHIAFSLALQKSLKRGVADDETTIKAKFDGTENLPEIIDRVEKLIMEAKKEKADTQTDDLVNKVMRGPHWFRKFIVNFLMWLDKHGMLPMSVLDALPFHTTFFITDMKSIKLPPLYHHVYNFGTTGLFFSTSKEEKVLYKDQITGEIKEKDIMRVSFVSDERFCDGYYFSVSCRMLKRILNNPKVLLEPIKKEDLPLTFDEEWERNHKKELEAKKAAKLAAKEAKKNKNKKAE